MKLAPRIQFCAPDLAVASIALKKTPAKETTFSGTLTSLSESGRLLEQSVLMDFANCQTDQAAIQRFLRMHGPPMFQIETQDKPSFAFLHSMWLSLQKQFQVCWDGIIGNAGKHEPYRSLGVALEPWRRSTANGIFEMRAGGLVYISNDLYGAMIPLLLSLHEIARRCLNPECKVTPYFFAGHKRQQYCSETCAAWAQKQWKKQWWKDRGPDWQQSKRTGATPKKTEGTNGTDETR